MLQRRGFRSSRIRYGCPTRFELELRLTLIASRRRFGGGELMFERSLCQMSHLVAVCLDCERRDDESALA